MSATYDNPAMPGRASTPTDGMAVARVSWGAIFAGAAIAIAIMIMLAMLGLGIGASTIDPLSNEGSGSGKATGSAIFFVISQLIALGAGGYVAARMARIPRPVPSAIHGVAVWAVATIGMTWIASSTVGALVGGGASMVSSASSGILKAGSAVIPDDLQMPDFSLSGLNIDDFPQPVQQAMQERGVTPENFKEKTQAAFRTVIDDGERERAKASLMTALKSTLATPGDIKAHFDRLTKTLSGPGGIFTDENKREALQAMQQQFGVSEAEAQAAYDKVVARYNEAVQGAQATVADVKQKSLEAADQAAKAVSKAGFAAFLASLLGLVVAAGAALVGRPKSPIGADADGYLRY